MEEKSEVIEKMEGMQVEQELTETQLNKAVRVQNIGKPFSCDLTGYGYGTRWPSKAVYFIPVKVFLNHQLLCESFQCL